MSTIPLRGRLSRTALLVAVATAAAALVVLPARAADSTGGGAVAADQPAGSPTGWLRVGHLAPAAPPVDITFATFGGPEQEVVRKAGYGAVTPYTTLQPGTYTIAMRPADAPPGSPPVLSQAVDVAAGNASTVLVFATGPGGELEARLTDDDLSAPGPGAGRVRLVQGAADLGPVEVTPVGATPLARDLTYGTTTPYTTVPEGRWTLRLRAADQVTEGTVDVRAGSSSTVVVVAGEGGPELRPLVDSAAAGAAPSGGVATGGGGTAGAR